MADAELVGLLRARLQTGGEDFLASLVAELGLPSPAVSPAPLSSLPGARRSARQSRPPARLSPNRYTPARRPAREQGSCVQSPGHGASRELATPPHLGPGVSHAPVAVSSEQSVLVPAAPVPRALPRVLAQISQYFPGSMGNNPSSSAQSSEGAVLPTPPPSQLQQSVQIVPTSEGAAAIIPMPSAPGPLPVVLPGPVEPVVPIQAPAVVCTPVAPQPPTRGDGRRAHGRGRSRSDSGSSSQGSMRRRRRGTAGHRRRHSRHHSRVSARSRCSHRSRSSRWRSPSSSEVSSDLSPSPERASGTRSRRRVPETASIQPSGVVSPSLAVAEVPSPPSVVPVPAQSGEFPYAGAWGEGSASPGLVSALKALVSQFESPRVSTAIASPPPLPAPEAARAGIHKDSFFCGISPLGCHLDDATKEKIWGNKYVDIWSLISVDQHTVDRERRVFSEKPADRKPKVARTMNNWLQAFSVLGCVMGQRHPERCSELFVYLDSVYSAYKSHGGSAWWRYDEDFRRRLAIQPEIGWGVKATDVWLRLMMAQKPSPFQSPATGSSSAIPGSVAVRRPGACWLYNDGHCKFFGLCKYKHECSACGGPHPASRCTRPTKPPSRNPSAAEGKDPGERPRDGAVARPLPGPAGR